LGILDFEGPLHNRRGCPPDALNIVTGIWMEALMGRAVSEVLENV
jgi:hypothetical protein